jgi:hypothetical protein
MNDELRASKTAPKVAAPKWPLQSQCDAFYGDPRGNGTYNPKWAGDNLTRVHCPWALHMGDIPIPSITIRKKVAPSLERVLARVWDELGHDEAKIRALRHDVFFGSFVYRSKRGARACIAKIQLATKRTRHINGVFTAKLNREFLRPAKIRSCSTSQPLQGV